MEMTASVQDEEEEAMGEESGRRDCAALCSVHCASKSSSNSRPVSGGLYGQIAELKAQIVQLTKNHSQEKDSWVSRVSELEVQQVNMKSEKRWLESKVKYLTHVIGTHGPKSCSFANKNVAHPPYTSMMNLSTGSNVMTPIQEADEDSSSYWAAEKEKLVKSNKQLLAQIRKLDEQRIRLNADVLEAREQIELLEFRILELQEEDGSGGSTTTSGHGNDKQFKDVCVGTDDPLPPVTASPLLEIVLEIPKKFCGWQIDKLSSLQSLAVLGLYKKLARELTIGNFPINVTNQIAESKMAPDKQTTVQRGENHESNAECTETHPVTAGPTGSRPDRESGESQRHAEGTHCDNCTEPKTRLDESSAPLLVELDTLEKRAKRFLDSSPRHQRALSWCDASTNTDPWPSQSSVTASTDPWPSQSSGTATTVADAWPRQSSRTSAGGLADRSWARESTPEAQDLTLAGPEVKSLRLVGSDAADASFLAEAAENARNLLAMKTQELLNKEAEYCMRLDALKCEKDECVYVLEKRLDALQERELRRRREAEALVAERLAECEDRLRRQAEAFDVERDDWSKRLRESGEAVERLDRMCRQMTEERQREAGEEAGDPVEELRERLEEMKRMDRKQKASIAGLERCLGALRAEVELSELTSPEASAGESEEDVLVRKVKDLVEAESGLRLRIGQLEKKEAAYRQTLDEADRIVADVERSHQERLEEATRTEAQLRAKIRRLEQNERWMSRALKAGSTAPSATEMLERLMEAEASEARLKEELYEGRAKEAEAEKRLSEAEEGMRTLSERLGQMEEAEGALRETLRRADDILAAREKALAESVERLQEELRELRGDERSGQKTDDADEGCHSEVGDVEEMTDELQKLNDRESGLELVKQRLSEVLSRVLVCPSCRPRCGQALGQLESRVQQLHEIVFGSSATGLQAVDPDVDVTHTGEEDEGVVDESHVQPKDVKMRSAEAGYPDADRIRKKDLEQECGEKDAEISSLSLHVAHLQEENEDLKRLLWSAEKRQTAAMDKAALRAEEAAALKKRAVDAEAKVTALVRQLRAHDQTQRDKENLQEALDACRVELKEKRDTEHRLRAENLNTRHKMEALRERVNSLQLLKKENKTMAMKQAVLEKRLSSAALSVAPLKQQIAALGQECWQKDRAIEELSKELSRALRLVDDHQSLVREYRTSKLQSISQSSDDSGITRDHSPTSMTSREDEASDDCALTDVSSISTVDVHYPTFATSKSDGADTPQTAAEDCGKKNASRIPRYTGLAAKPANGLPPKGQRSGSAKSAVVSGQVDAKKKPTGGPRRARRYSNSSSDGSTCSERVAQWTMSVHRQRLPKPPVPSDKPAAPAPEAAAVTRIAPYSVRHETRTPPVPDAPAGFRVTRKVGQDGLLVAWDVPLMDSSGCSNGSTVSGYQIFVNGRLHQNVRSAHRTKALLNNLDLSEDVLPLDVAIKTLSLTGLESEAVGVKYEGEESISHQQSMSTNRKNAFQQLRQKFNVSYPERGRITDYVAEQAERTSKLTTTSTMRSKV